MDDLRQQYIEEVERLSQDILFSLNTNFPVSTTAEMQLFDLLDGENTLEIAKYSPSLYKIHEFFLDNKDCDKAWNLRNMMTSINFDFNDR